MKINRFSFKIRTYRVIFFNLKRKHNFTYSSQLATIYIIALSTKSGGKMILADFLCIIQIVLHALFSFFFSKNIANLIISF